MAEPNQSDEPQLPAELQESLQTLIDRIFNNTAKRELWKNRFTSADRRKFPQPEAETLEQHNIIDLWRIARGTPTWNECIVEVSHALGFINDTRRQSLLDALGANDRSGQAPGQKARRAAAIPHWDEESRELRYQGQLVRIVRRPSLAPNIVRLLRTFEKAGWPARIDDPFHRQRSDETRRRDVETLNKRLLKPLLKFECDGNGTGFLWKKIMQPRAKKPAKRPRR